MPYMDGIYVQSLSDTNAKSAISGGLLTAGFAQVQQNQLEPESTRSLLESLDQEVSMLAGLLGFINSSLSGASENVGCEGKAPIEPAGYNGHIIRILDKARSANKLGYMIQEYLGIKG